MTDDKWGQPSNELSVGATSDLTYGCPHLSRESLGARLYALGILLISFNAIFKGIFRPFSRALYVLI